MKNSLVIILILLCAGCSKEYTHHGYNFEHNSFEAIKIGETSAAQVLTELGTPTTESTFGKKYLYYISNKVEKLAFFDPKIVEQKVLVIGLNQNDVVSEIQEFTLDDANHIMFSESKTQIRGNTLTPAEQILTNIGKFNKTVKPY